MMHQEGAGIISGCGGDLKRKEEKNKGMEGVDVRCRTDMHPVAAPCSPPSSVPSHSPGSRGYQLSAPCPITLCSGDGTCSVPAADNLTARRVCQYNNVKPMIALTNPLFSRLPSLSCRAVMTACCAMGPASRRLPLFRPVPISCSGPEIGKFPACPLQSRAERPVRSWPIVTG